MSQSFPYLTLTVINIVVIEICSKVLPKDATEGGAAFTSALEQANKEAVVAPVAVCSAFGTTWLGISLCFWIWLHGIDRFLSRQM